jgi:TetR/AcrR family transcriptional regulator, regulator of cefoperazone and chloramphenicol sensitivity
MAQTVDEQADQALRLPRPVFAGLGAKTRDRAEQFVGLDVGAHGAGRGRGCQKGSKGRPRSPFEVSGQGVASRVARAQRGGDEVRIALQFIHSFDSIKRLIYTSRMNDELTSSRASPERGDAARARLIEAAIDVFGLLGFEGASTRAVAKAAGVNLQAISYYFGGKDSLYLAVADHILERITAYIGPTRDRVRARLVEAKSGGPAIAAEEARELLTAVLSAMAEVFVGRESESWARYMIREQMQPTEVFRRLYGALMGPLLEALRQLVAVLLEEDPASERVRLRALALIGSVIVFRVGHAVVVAQLGWDEAKPEHVAKVQAIVREIVDGIQPVKERVQ